jgi:hypothetical protein
MSEIGYILFHDGQQWHTFARVSTPPSEAPLRQHGAVASQGSIEEDVGDARFEIALTVCDGVLQISITVADSER